MPGVEDPDVRRLPVHNFPYHVIFISFERRLGLMHGGAGLGVDERVLTPAASDELYASAFEGALVRPGGSTAGCAGAVRKSVPGRQLRVVLSLRTTAHRRAELLLRFACASDVHVGFVIDGDVAHTFSAKAAGALTLHEARIDVTQWTEPARETEAMVDFDFGATDGVIYLFESGSDCATVLATDTVTTDTVTTDTVATDTVTTSGW